MTTGETLQEAAARLSRWYRDDVVFIRAVDREARRRVKWQSMGGSWDVHSAERAWREGYGDCSEQALVIMEMLKVRPHIDARLVWGACPGRGRHDSVEIHINHRYWIIDKDQVPDFVKMGEGLLPGERVIE